MRLTQIERGLRGIKRFFYDRRDSRILEDDAPNILEDALAQAKSSKQRYDDTKRRTDNPNLRREPWGYEVYPYRPLRFRPSEAIIGLNVRVDLYCKLLWEGEAQQPVKQDIHLRLWSSELDYAFRKDWDSEQVLDRLTAKGNRGRVLTRFHFDLANEGQAGPRYHFQVGGEAREDELCWLLGDIDLPRLSYPPMDLPLATQVIAANFFQNQYKSVRPVPELRAIICLSQRSLLAEYFQKCLTVVQGDNSLLDHLWNTPD